MVIGVLLRQNEAIRNSSFREPQRRNLHEFWYCHSVGHVVVKQGDLGRDRQTLVPGIILKPSY
jgi:hypothetical protein